MTKSQGRIYFLYPFLLGVAHYFFNTLTSFYEKFHIGQDNTLLFFYVLIFSAVIALAIEKNNFLAEIFSIAGSVIIFSLLFLISEKEEFVLNSVIVSILFSFLVHVICIIIYMVIYYLFEWFFKETKREKIEPYVEAE